ncbi:hypothetical protein Sste5346_005023 [Sporothrix stenoceras]|uniref:Cytoskeleton organization protein n=1 Tax=Sporothrix stenoceras TaxID=5173 RepID=A0ABR3Z8S3_9PEZI
MSHYARQRPPLKNGVDMQLQAAFANQNWTTVIQLADKRHKASKDPYFEVVKVCAETRLDGVTEKASAAVLVDSWVHNNTIPQDLDSIELLEWATDAENDDYKYGETFGVLRARWVKVNPRNVAAATASLRMCLQAWDLTNAQQIATILDKSSHTHDRRYTFWGILLTHLLSKDTAQAESKRKIYGMLAQKQLEKAAEPAEAAETTAKITDNTTNISETDRSLHTEEEFLLYLRVLAEHGTADNYAQRALHKTAGAAAQLAAAGRKQLFYEVLERLETLKRWDSVFDLCREALSLTTSVDQPSTLACDVRIWNSFVTAAQKSDNPETAFDTVQSLLTRFIGATSPKLPQMYTKNVGLALLQTTFGLPPALLPEPAEGQSSLQVEQLLAFIEANLDKASLFNDVRSFVERLSFNQAQDLLTRLEVPSTTLRRVLVLKLRYLLATCPETRCPRSILYNQTEAEADQALLKGDGGPSLFELACKVCRNAAPESYGCTHCLQELAKSSLQLHHSLSDDSEFLSAVPKMDKDPRIDLALVAASSLLRLAGDGSDTKSRPLLQAALVLDAQQRQTPDDIPLRLLMVRVFLRLSCGSHAQQLWQPLGVKRSILDALGPLFYDRLSTVAPGLFAGASTPKKPLLLEPLKQYFATVLRHPSAVRIWDAFASGSYSSILDMATYQVRLQRSCTRAMTVVEERRAARALGGRLDDSLLEDVSTDIPNGERLHNATDYGALPNLESSFGAHLVERVSLGPGFSNTRMQLSLLAERYLEVIMFKPPKEYKPAKAGEATARDKAFVVESLARIQFAFDDLLHGQPDPTTQLTPAELAYYTAVSVLVSFAAFSLNSTTGDTAPTPSSIFALLNQSLTTTVDLLRKAALPPVSSSPTTSTLLHTFTDIHSLGILRETAVAIKQTGTFLAAFHDKENARDRTGKSGLGKEAVASAASFKTLSTRLFTDIKAHVKTTKDTLGSSGWLDRLGETVTKPGESEGQGQKELAGAIVAAVGGSSAVEYWAGRLLDDWRETIRGWGQVQME